MCSVLSLLLALSASGPAGDSASGPPSWREADAFRRQLEAPVSLFWSHVPLRQGLRDLARQRRVALFLDRRVDPGLPVHFSVRAVPLEDGLRGLAQHLHLSIAILEPVVYLGPPATVQKLATVHHLCQQQVGDLPVRLRLPWRRRLAVSWLRLAEPRQVVTRLAAEAGISLRGVEKIPHDLWPAASLPRLSACTWLTLLLAGFDLTFAVDSAGQATIQPLPAEVTVERTYRVPDPADRLAERLRSALPDARISASARQLVVSARWEDHVQLQRLLSGKPADQPAPAARETRYTLQAAGQPLEPFLHALCGQLGLRVEFAPEIGDARLSRVTFTVTEATREQLLRAVLAPLGCDFHLADDVVRVFRKEPGDRTPGSPARD
jgi:hypothetical protein